MWDSEKQAIRNTMAAARRLTVLVLMWKLHVWARKDSTPACDPGADYQSLLLRKTLLTTAELLSKVKGIAALVWTSISHNTLTENDLTSVLKLSVITARRHSWYLWIASGWFERYRCKQRGSQIASFLWKILQEGAVNLPSLAVKVASSPCQVNVALTPYQWI